MVKKKKSPLPPPPSSEENTSSERPPVVTNEAMAPSWDRLGGLADSLPDLAAEYLVISAQIRELEARKTEIRKMIETIIIESCEPDIRGDFFLVETVVSHRPKRLSETKLLEAGIEMEVIEYAREGGEEYTYVKVSAAVEG